MELRGICFNDVGGAAGTRGFFSEKEYWYHSYLSPWKWSGLSFRNVGFTAKTTTFEARTGNMPMQQDGVTPKEFAPACIVVKPIQGIVLNAVGLSGPGAPNLLERDVWQQRKGDPFFLSFMSVAQSVLDRLDELKDFVQLAKTQLPNFNSHVGLEMNFSCPNVGVHASNFLDEIGRALDIAGELNIPLQCKFNATTPVEAVCEIAKHRECDAITMSNTIPWGKLPHRINWKELFGTETSPLEHLGGGGLSGWPLAPIVCDWIRNARDCGLMKPIWACGGIDSVHAVLQAKCAGATGVQIGTVAMLRPWRMRSIIRCAHELFSKS